MSAHGVAHVPDGQSGQVRATRKSCALRLVGTQDRAGRDPRAGFFEEQRPGRYNGKAAVLDFPLGASNSASSVSGAAVRLPFCYNNWIDPLPETRILPMGTNLRQSYGWQATHRLDFGYR